MFQSLYAKLALALLGLFCLLGLSLVILTQFASDMYQQEVIQKLNHDLAQQIVAQKNLMKDHQVRRQELKGLFHMLMVVNPGIEVYLLNPEGEILAFSAPPGKVKLKQVDLKPLRRFLGVDPVFPLIGDDPRHPDRKKVFSAARIPQQGPLEGYLYIILGGELFDSVVHRLKDSYILRLSFWWVGASLLFVLLTSLMLFAYLTRRLRHLASVMDTLDMDRITGQTRRSGFQDRERGDEIDRLSATFEKLVERVRMQVNKLQEADHLRRELLTNVSHDLRTPLATLQGYIESLYLKGESLSRQDRRNHLMIAIQHCERLGQLIDELFELAKLDSGEIRMNPEAFNIVELAHDIAQKFKLTAQKKQIALLFESPDNIPFVRADIAMIERVIENLIENALRYTPSEGIIRLSFEAQNGHVAIRVSDTGSGISANDLPYIFDRFYQREKTREAKAGYAGLGLAIAKRIIELHGQKISVESDAASGTTFFFRLST